MVFSGITVNNRRLEEVLTDIDKTNEIYPKIRGIYFDNVTPLINNNNYIDLNILTGYAFYRNFELVSVGFVNQLISDQNLAKIASDLFVYVVDLLFIHSLMLV